MADKNQVQIIGQVARQVRTILEGEDATTTGDTSTINHFPEKLLLLKDRMNTKTARQISERRHAYTEEFLAEFLAEWDGRD